jgi:hypothetical protein
VLREQMGEFFDGRFFPVFGEASLVRSGTSPGSTELRFVT